MKTKVGLAFAFIFGLAAWIGLASAQTAPHPLAGDENILGLKVKEVPYYQTMTLVVVESISPSSPCQEIVKPNYQIFGINPDGTSIKGKDYIFTLKDFDAKVSRIKPGTTIGMRVCESGSKCNNFKVKIPKN